MPWNKEQIGKGAGVCPFLELLLAAGVATAAG